MQRMPSSNVPPNVFEWLELSVPLVLLIQAHVSIIKLISFNSWLCFGFIKRLFKSFFCAALPTLLSGS